MLTIKIVRILNRRELMAWFSAQELRQYFPQPSSQTGASPLISQLCANKPPTGLWWVLPCEPIAFYPQYTLSLHCHLSPPSNGPKWLNMLAVITDKPPTSSWWPLFCRLVTFSPGQLDPLSQFYLLQTPSLHHLHPPPSPSSSKQLIVLVVITSDKPPA